MGQQTRRDILKLASYGVGAGCVSGWLDVVAQQALAQEQTTRKKPKACIVLFMSGGPAHTFTFDLKPGDKGCPYKPIPTSVPGIQISEHLPKVAKQMHHMALVRGMSTAIADHQPAHYLMRTGFRQMAGLTHPHVGAVVADQLVREDTGMPSFVLLKPGSGSTRGASAGFLNPACRPLILRDVSQGIANLNPSGGLDPLLRKADLLQEVDQGFLDEYQSEAIRAKLAGYQKAVQLMDMDKAREAFKVDKEPQHVRDLYGDTIFGKQCLGARRLIEHGVKYVEVMHPSYWDTHGGQVEGQKKHSQVLDQPMAALLADLHDRGLLEETLVIWMGEFGRDYSGGNHYAKAWTTIFAGAGVKGGRAIGRTDKKGMTVEDRPVSVADFSATIFKALGIDYTKKNWVRGRPITLVDGKVNPVDELFA
jgi:hypothetical protein